MNMEGVNIKRRKDRDHLCVGNLPGRQKPMLYRWNSFDGVTRTLGYFQSEAYAEEFADYLWDLALAADAEVLEPR